MGSLLAGPRMMVAMLMVGAGVVGEEVEVEDMVGVEAEVGSVGGEEAGLVVGGNAEGKRKRKRKDYQLYGVVEMAFEKVRYLEIESTACDCLERQNSTAT
jgi:hypothetical protein